MGVPSAVTAFCFWILQKQMNKRDMERKERDLSREKNEILMIQGVGAAIALGEATAIAIINGKCNGELTAAMEYAKDIKHKQKDFLTEQGIKNLF
jgi:hypothetical protein